MRTVDVAGSIAGSLIPLLSKESSDLQSPELLLKNHGPVPQPSDRVGLYGQAPDHFRAADSEADPKLVRPDRSRHGANRWTQHGRHVRRGSRLQASVRLVVPGEGAAGYAAEELMGHEASVRPEGNRLVPKALYLQGDPERPLAPPRKPALMDLESRLRAAAVDPVHDPAGAAHDRHRGDDHFVGSSAPGQNIFHGCISWAAGHRIATSFRAE